MNKTTNKAKSINIVVLVIKRFIDNLRQNSDIYPIRYYKKIVGAVISLMIKQLGVNQK